MSKKWREFWIAQGITANGDDHVWESKPNFELFWTGSRNKEVIHAIEYGAYQSLQKKLEIAKEALNNIKTVYYGREYFTDHINLALKAIREIEGKDE